SPCAEAHPSTLDRTQYSRCAKAPAGRDSGRKWDDGRAQAYRRWGCGTAVESGGQGGSVLELLEGNAVLAEAVTQEDERERRGRRGHVSRTKLGEITRVDSAGQRSDLPWSP